MRKLLSHFCDKPLFRHLEIHGSSLCGHIFVYIGVRSILISENLRVATFTNEIRLIFSCYASKL